MLWPTITTAVALVVLVSLGVWQLDRLGQKKAILADIEAGLAAEPRPLPPVIDKPDAWSFRPVIVTGILEHDREVFLYAPNLQGQVGYHVLTPLVRDQGSPVLVDRGWVPVDRKAAGTRSEGRIAGSVTLAGIARVPEMPGPFIPDPDRDERVWFAVDLESIASMMGLDLAPVIVQADDSPNPGGFPVGGQTRIDIPNNHLDYALTWFGLAVALTVIFVVYWRRRR